MQITPTQRKALRQLARGPQTPQQIGVPYTTFMALERMRLIHVETTFGSIMFPRNALAWIKPEGRTALKAGDAK